MEGGDIAMNHLGPAINLVSRCVTASPISAHLSGTTPQPSSDSVPAGGATNGNLLRTPVVMNAQSLSSSPPSLRHDMRYAVVMMPPCVLHLQR